MKGEGNGRSNVILLTVIAIVTMIIVVVGATFAYLASSVDSDDVANINATTNASSDLLLFNAGQDIELLATIENFSDEDPSLSDTVNADVFLQTKNPDGVTYNYGVYLTVPQNDFEYTSGTCYAKAEKAPVAASAEECLANNPTNIWATEDGESYACYTTSQAITGPAYNNELACLAGSRYMWSPLEAAELVIDLYRSDDSIEEEAACTSVGVCVDNKRSIVEADNESACTSVSTNTWLPNIYSEGVCYGVVKTADLTTVVTNEDAKLSLIDSVAISADANAGTAHYYKAVVTLINHNHNQIVNGNKKFNGYLHFERLVVGE